MENEINPNSDGSIVLGKDLNFFHSSIKLLTARPGNSNSLCSIPACSFLAFCFVFSNNVAGSVILSNFIVHNNFYIHVAGFRLTCSQTGTEAKARLCVRQVFCISCP